MDLDFLLFTFSDFLLFRFFQKVDPVKLLKGVKVCEVQNLREVKPPKIIRKTPENKKGKKKCKKRGKPPKTVTEAICLDSCG